MKKIAILTMAACVCLTAPTANAQFLKKLSKAAEKLTQAVSSGDKTQTGNLGRQIGKSIQLGDMTMSAYGDNPGVGFNFGYCYWQDGRVVLVFQLPNQGRSDVENIWIHNYEPNETQVFGTDGSKYNIAMISLGDRNSSEGVSNNLAAGGYLNGILVIDAPQGVKALGTVIFRCSGQYPMDANTHSYAFVLQNVSIQPAPPTQQTTADSYAKPAEGWTIDANGTGPCKLGAKVSSLPAAVDGMYDKIDGDDDFKYLYLGDTHVINLNCANGVIVGIQIVGENIGVKVGDKIFKMGDDTDVLKAQSGVKGVSYNDDAEYNGVHFSGHDSTIELISIGQN